MNYIIGLVLMIAAFEKLLENYHIQRPDNVRGAPSNKITEFLRLTKKSVKCQYIFTDMKFKRRAL